MTFPLKSPSGFSVATLDCRRVSGSRLIFCLTKSKMIATHHMLEMLDMLDRRQTNQYIPRLSAWGVIKLGDQSLLAAVKAGDKRVVEDILTQNRGLAESCSLVNCMRCQRCMHFPSLSITFYTVFAYARDVHGPNDPNLFGTDMSCRKPYCAQSSDVQPTWHLRILL